MIRIAAVMGLLAATCTWASEGQAESRISRHHGRSGNVLERVDRLLDDACSCDATVSTKCGCSRPERRVFERLTGTQRTPELPKDARHDASAGVLL